MRAAAARHAPHHHPGTEGREKPHHDHGRDPAAGTLTSRSKNALSTARDSGTVAIASNAVITARLYT